MKPGQPETDIAVIPAISVVLAALAVDVNIYSQCSGLLTELAAHDLLNRDRSSAADVCVLLVEQCDRWLMSADKFSGLHLGQALCRAVSCHANASARYLLEKDASPGFALRSNETPLHQAARGGNLEMMRVMIDQYDALQKLPSQGVWQNNKGPLQYAAESGHIEIIRLLQERGISLAGKPTLEAHTILHFSVMNGHADTVDQMLHDEMLAVDAADGGASTPLYYAVAEKRPEARRALVDVLMKHGADPQLARIFHKRRQVPPNPLI